MARHRRGHGEGTITRHKASGKWMAQLSIGYDPATGKLKRVTKYFDTRQEAQEWLAKAQHELNTGQFVEPDRTTFGEWLDVWLYNYKRMKVRKTTFGNYETMIRTYIKPALGGLTLKQIQPNTLQRFYSHLLENGRKKEPGGLSSRAVHYVHTLINAALNQAVKENLIFRNPADAVELPKMQKREMEPMTREEISRFLEAIKGDRLYPAFALMLKTGLRRGELLGLRWCDIDLKEKKLHVRQILVEARDPNGEKKVALVFQEPKTKKSMRTIPLTDDLIKLLKAHKAKQNEERLFFGKAYQDHGLVFCSEDGRPIWPRNFLRHFTELQKRAGIKHHRLHDLRHTFATLLLAEGEELKNVQELLGHEKISTTADIYTKVLEESKRKAVTKLDSIIRISID